MAWRWLLTGACVLVSLWFAYLAIFNWWAAGGPPTPHAAQYAFRGNVFFVLAGLLLFCGVLLSILNIRKARGGGAK